MLKKIDKGSANLNWIFFILFLVVTEELKRVLLRYLHFLGLHTCFRHYEGFALSLL